MSTKTFAVWPDTHCNTQDEAAVAWGLDLLEDRKPDVVIHIGDLIEALAASRWPSEARTRLSAEYESANTLLQRIMEAAPDAEYVFMEGNHDANCIATHRIPEDLRDLTDYRKHITNLKHWKQIPYIYDRNKGTFRIGQVTFAHGYETGSGANRFQSILLGVPWGLTVMGHTHRPQRVEQTMLTADVPLPYFSANVGSFGPLKPGYVARKRTHHWGQGICFGEAQILKSPRLSRCWEAEVLIRKMGWEE